MNGLRTYVVCATPRTGSTLLCSLLTSTGVLGAPESYVRGPDEARWAARWGLQVRDGRVTDYRCFVDRVRRTGTDGVVGVRIMWGSIARPVQALRRQPDQSELAVLQEALGPITFLYLRRTDTVAQAVSWARAEQTGYWQSGDTSRGTPTADIDQLLALYGAVTADDAAWRGWFDVQGVRATQLTYEQVVADPGGAVGAVAAAVGVALPVGWRPVVRHRRQADEVNHAWARLLRARLDC